MTSLKDKIKVLKPNLKDSSVNLYLTNLKKIYRDIECEGRKEICNFDNLNFLDNYERVMESLADQNLNTKKNRLIGVVVSLQATKASPKLIARYTKEMIDLANKSNENYKKQEKSQKQVDNWVEYEDLVRLANNMLAKLKKHSILTKEELTRAEYNLLQEYIVLRFYLNFPLRNDLADVRIISDKSEDNKKDNFLLVDENNISLILNDYKTVKTFGPQEYNLDKKFSKVIKIFLKHNRSGFFITKSNRNEAITPNGITKLLNRLFKRELDKQISTSMIRHITATYDRKNDKTLAELEALKAKIQKKYLHSDDTNQLYRKVK